MKVLDLFSKRQRQLRGDAPDVFLYDDLPQELRIQLVHIFKDYLGGESDAQNRQYMVGGAYDFIVSTLCREYGVFSLGSSSSRGNRSNTSEFFDFILTESDVERVLDAVEIACRILDIHARKFNYRYRKDGDEQADAALAEINARFQYRAVGYRFESGNIVRVDSELVHAEVVKPALSLLHDKQYAGAEAEFHLAFEHYRHGRAKEALAECLKSLESTMKTIAKLRGWVHEANATAKPLLDLMFKEQVVPQFWAQHFSGLRAVLESGVPTARNRLGGHGQGAAVVDVPEHLVGYTINQTAAAIVYLVKAEQALPR